MGAGEPIDASAKLQANPADRAVPFGKYLLLDRISVGGMAEVFRAKAFGAKGFERIVAIKRILPVVAEDKEFVDMFVDEAKIAGRLSHPNICPIYELGQIEESYYIAMEYVWGKDILQIINRFRRLKKRMPPVMAAWIASKVAAGLDYAHNKRDAQGQGLGIIHRDVSPQNIIVSYDGAVKLIDFGIAKAALRNTQTKAGVLKGKFGYMSPEQVRGQSIDHRSDIFGLGTCLYEMVTGERLFLGESDFATLELVKDAKIKPPRTYCPDLPDMLDAALMKALSREPTDRWQTAGAFQQELQAFIASQEPPYNASSLASWMKATFTTERKREKTRLDAFRQATQSQPPPPAAYDDLLDEEAIATGHEHPVKPGPSAAEAPQKASVPNTLALSEPEPQGRPSSSISDENETTYVESAEKAEQAVVSPAATVRLPEMPTKILASSGNVEPDGAASTRAPGQATTQIAPQLAPGRQAPNSGASSLDPDQGAPTVEPETEPRGALLDDAGQAPVVPGSSSEAPPSAKRTRTDAVQMLNSGDVVFDPRKHASSATWQQRSLFIVLMIGAVAGSIGSSLATRIGQKASFEVRISNTDGGTVLLDGKELGIAPLIVRRVPGGQHTIEVHADGFEPYARQLELARGTNVLIDVALTPKKR